MLPLAVQLVSGLAPLMIVPGCPHKVEPALGVMTLVMRKKPGWIQKVVLMPLALIAA